MDDDNWARDTLVRMLTALNDVLEGARGLSRDEFLRDEELHFLIMQAIVALGMGVEALLNAYPRGLHHRLWWRYSELRYGLLGGHSHLDFAHLWWVIPQEWPGMRRELMELWERHSDDGSGETQ